MFIVLLHLNSFTADTLYSYDKDEKGGPPAYPKITDVLELMRKDGEQGLVLCGMEAFVNLYAYDVSFGICSWGISLLCLLRIMCFVLSMGIIGIL